MIAGHKNQTQSRLSVKPGDLIRVRETVATAHPVGIVAKVVHEDGRDHMWCLYMDGDYEVLEYDTEFEVISESR